MADNTPIEWTDDSWNPIRARDTVTGKVGWHCVHASEGCRFCYAEGFNRRLGTGHDYKPALTRDRIEIFLDEKMLLAPLRKRKRRKIFVCSMTDLGADFVTDEMLDRVFAAMVLSPDQTFQVLTKRPDRLAAYLAARRTNDAIGSAVAELSDEADRRRIAHDHPGWAFTRGDTELVALPNVWIGTSVEDQRNADLRRPHLQAIADLGWLTWVSYEPALGPVDWTPWSFIKWLVCGGESGPKARPMHPAWARLARDWCGAIGVAFLLKQWGGWLPWLQFNEAGVQDPNPEQSRFDAVIWDAEESRWEQHGGGWQDDPGAEGPDDLDQIMGRVGKKVAGRLLDGVTHDGFPEGR